jgi:predicted ABC-class ATPase
VVFSDSGAGVNADAAAAIAGWAYSLGMASSARDLRRTLARIDGRGYRAYQDIAGAYALDGFTLHVDHVQGDPFAAPSRLRATLPAPWAGFAPWYLGSRARRVALGDYLVRAFADELVDVGARRGGRRGSGKSGLVAIDAPGQEVLERTAVTVAEDGAVEARFVAGLPARGRTVLGRQAEELLLDEIPSLVEASLRASALDDEHLRRHVECVEDQRALRAALVARGLVAFVGDGARLPRRSGVDARPMADAVRFVSPASLAVEVDVPHAGRLRGMGIPAGVTLIVGGGYHGKSTLLAALELGVYDHVHGDGRERVVTDPAAVKVRAEDGRRVERVDISAFIRNLPLGRDTRAFSSEDASGSTSQAASIMEALEVGARVLLIDEDTSASNFMIRDDRMQRLVATDKEPIVPFIDKVRQLARERGVSTILVVGGAGDYFDVADHVLQMDEYRAVDATDAARRIAGARPSLRTSEGGDSFGRVPRRAPVPESIDPSRNGRAVKIDVRGVGDLRFGEWDVDLSLVEQLVDPSQTRAIGHALVWLEERLFDGRITLAEALGELEVRLEAEGLDATLARGHGGLALPRRFEIAAALNRLRSLRVNGEKR